MTTKFLHWTIIVTLLFHLFVFVMHLSGAPIVELAANWLSTEVASWIQAIAAAATVGIGWRALAIWREQAQTTARADTTKLIAPAVVNLERKLAPAFSRGTYSLPIHREKLQHTLTTKRSKAFKDLEAAAIELQVTLVSVADDILHKKLTELLEIVHRAIDAHFYLTLILDDFASTEDLDADASKEAAALLTEIGFRERGTLGDNSTLNVAYDQLNDISKLMRDIIAYRA